MTTKEAVLVERAEETAAPVVQDARAIRVATPEELDVAADFLGRIKAAKAEVEDIFKEPKADAFRAHRSICKAEKRVLAPLVEADRYLRGQVAAYHRHREKERRRLELEARRRAEEEAEKAREAALDAALDAGDEEEAERIVDGPTAAYVAPVELPPEPEAPENVSVRKTWKGRVTDKEKLIRERPSLAARLLSVDQSAVNKFARETEGTVKAPGVEVYPDTTTVVR